MPIPDFPSGWTDYGIAEQRVSCRGFEGRFCLNPKLPYTAADYYYRDEEADIIVLMTGNVYNRDELSGLCSGGKVTAGPELAARMLLKEGEEFVKRLNGDFAIFACRPVKGEAYLFRDHAGIKPLAWAVRDNMLFFSSGLTLLCRFCQAGELLNDNYFLKYFKYVSCDESPCGDVKRLMNGHYLHFTAGGVRIVKYWQPGKIRTCRSMQYERMIDDMKTLLADSVKIRCDSRFNAGAHVSSGLDSGLTASLARREYANQNLFYGFSWSPAGFTGKTGYDEREPVRKLCEEAGISPVFSTLTPDDILRYMRYGYVSPWYLQEMKTAETASALKVNLLFSGWGGDEFISNGDRGIEQDLLRHLSLRIFFRRNPLFPLKKFIRNQLSYVIFPALGIPDRSIARAFRDDARYLKKYFRKSDRKAIRNIYFHSSRRQMHLRMLRSCHLQERCETWSVMGFMNGLEYRYPLLDRRIIEYMLQIPSELLCRTNIYRPLPRILGTGILPEEVLRNNSKEDPVYREWMNDLLRQTALKLMNAAAGLRENPRLHFIDFDLLEEDIAKYRQNPDSVDRQRLFRALVYIHFIHFFSPSFSHDSREFS